MLRSRTSLSFSSIQSIIAVVRNVDGIKQYSPKPCGLSRRLRGAHMLPAAAKDAQLQRSGGIKKHSNPIGKQMMIGRSVPSGTQSAHMLLFGANVCGLKEARGLGGRGCSSFPFADMMKASTQ